jgi:hypothetical protein
VVYAVSGINKLNLFSIPRSVVRKTVETIKIIFILTILYSYGLTISVCAITIVHIFVLDLLPSYFKGPLPL